MVIGNGSLLIAFDRSYNLVDVYYPHAGQENHGGHPWRFGVWTEEQFAWTSDDDWKREQRYLPETLVTSVQMEHAAMRLRLTCEDAVDFGRALYVKRVQVTNTADHERQIRLFFHIDPHMWGNAVGDTVYFDPAHRALIAYKGKRYIWLSGSVNGTPGLRTFATGNKELPGQEGTWRDAEDGELSGHSIAQGSVDGVGELTVVVPAGRTAEAFFWMAFGEDYREVRDLDAQVRARGAGLYIKRTADYWMVWAGTEDPMFANLPPDIAACYRQSLLVLRTHLDDDGGVIAASDSDIVKFGRDTYTYIWPRDGALVTYALIQAGHVEAARRFFNFCQGLFPRDGYLLHKYNPDGSPGSSWHPWSTPEQELQLPIQEDETALVLWALWAHFQRFRDVEFIRPLYRPLIKSAADFLCRYREPITGLPAPSYDLWEERHGILSFTTAAVYAGLHAAANFANTFGETDLGVVYQRTAQEIREAALKFLYDEERGCFSRMINVQPDGTIERDHTVDASLAGLFQFGMLSPDDEPMAKTMAEIEECLWVRTEVGGVARYENDYYFQQSDDIKKVPGNPWIICTLWLADWYITRATQAGDLDRARELMEWVVRHALPSGILAEQVHPYTGEPLSVSPLTWSHGAFVTTVHNYVAKAEQLNISVG
jgi:oligosaccharide amylase